MDGIKDTVFICCATYNHAPYIEDALNGFCIQQTDFPFVAVVIDDYSNDGTWDKINSFFLHNCDFENKATSWEKEDDDAIIKYAKHKTNENLSFEIIRLKYNHYSIKRNKKVYFKDVIAQSKYCAYCEGDDYWIDPNKLAKQVAILDSTPGCVMVRTNINRFFQDENRIEESFFTRRESGNVKDSYKGYILRSWFNAPCTWCFHSDMWEKIELVKNSLDGTCFIGDALNTLVFCRHGSIKYVDDITTVYRILKESASHCSNNRKNYDFWYSITRTRTYFANDFNVGFRMRFWLHVCWELLYKMAYRKDVSYIFNWMSFCIREFQFLFVKSKRLKIKL